MLELNKVMLIGNLTRDPEMSNTSNGTPLAKMGLAVNRTWKDKAGERQEDTSFFDVTAWRGTAEFCGKHLKKGSRVFVEGELKQDSWETDEGHKRSRVTVTAQRVQFAAVKGATDAPRTTTVTPEARRVK